MGRMKHIVADRHAEGQSAFARRFFLGCAAVYGLVAGSAYTMIELWPPVVTPGELTVPVAFWISTPLLIVVSVAVHHSLNMVRMERQTAFRRSLNSALLTGTCFVSVQSYGLSSLMQMQVPTEASTGAPTFVFVFAALHALHATVALLVLTFVTLKAAADRYDHEYYWGVAVCTYFWHLLGAVWLCIFAVFAVVM